MSLEQLKHIKLEKPKEYNHKVNWKELAKGKTGDDYKQHYHNYLKSNEWITLREKIMRRDKWTCQGCLDPADVVHHLTYSNVFEEWAFELMALCNTCHARIHKDEL